MYSMPDNVVRITAHLKKQVVITVEQKAQTSSTSIHVKLLSVAI